MVVKIGVSNYDADSHQASHKSTFCQFINTLSSGACDQSGSNAEVEDSVQQLVDKRFH